MTPPRAETPEGAVPASGGTAAGENQPDRADRADRAGSGGTPAPWLRLARRTVLAEFAFGAVFVVGYLVDIRDVLLGGPHHHSPRGLPLIFVVLAGMIVSHTAGGALRYRRVRWRLTGNTLQINTTGPLSRTVSVSLTGTGIKVNRPFAARLFGLVEVTAEEIGQRHRLKYVTARDAAGLRRALADYRGRREDTPPGTQGPGTPGGPRVAWAVPVHRLLGSLLLTFEFGFFLVPVVAAAVASGNRHGFSLTRMAAAVGLVSVATFPTAGRNLLERAKHGWKFTARLDGPVLTVTHGFMHSTGHDVALAGLGSVEMVQPLLWRAFGWVRVTSHGPSGHVVLCPVLPTRCVPLVVGNVVPHAGPVLDALARAVPVPRPRGVPGGRRVAAVLTGEFVAYRHFPRFRRNTTVLMPVRRVQTVTVTAGPARRLCGLALVRVGLWARHTHSGSRWHPSVTLPAGPARDLSAALTSAALRAARPADRARPSG